MPEESSRENYFDLLEMDPDAPWSDSEFARVLAERRAQWTKDSGNPRPEVKLRAKKNQDSLSDIQRVMTDPALREKERIEARNLLAERKRDAQQKLLENLDLQAGKGYVTDTDVEKLVANSAKTGVLTEAEIRKTIHEAIKRQDIQIKPESPGEPPDDVLDPTLAKEIRANLRVLGKTSLYEFLGLDGTTRSAELLQKADKLYVAASTSTKNSASLSAQKTLTGYARNIFSDGDKRRKYDNTLRNEALEDLEPLITSITSVSGVKRIHAGQLLKLLERAKAKNIEAELAMEYILKIAQKGNIYVEPLEGGSVTERILCSACRHINDTHNVKCSNCGAPLKIRCPSCPSQVQVDAGACPQCGFPVGNVNLVRDLLKQATASDTRGDYRTALDQIRDAATAWNTIPPKKERLTDELSVAIHDLKQKLEILIGKQDELQASLDDALYRHRYYQAHSLIQQIDPSKQNEALKDTRDRIDKKIKWAEGELERARVIEAQGEDAAENYQRILQEVTDCDAARKALAKTPPPSPSDLKLNSTESHVSLQWQPSPAQGVEYVILRKLRVRPSGVNDGEQIGRTQGMFFDDANAPVGVPIFYAVYADRTGVPSRTGAVANQPVFLIGNVTDPQAQVDDRLVLLNWELPKYATGIRIYRSTLHPQGANTTGNLLQVPDPMQGQVTDKDVTNGTTYYYSFFCVFKNEGKELRSPTPVIIEATPEKPPQAVHDLQIELKEKHEKQGERVIWVKWAPPEKGEFHILRSEAPPAAGASDGDRPAVPLSRIKDYGELLRPIGQPFVLTLQANTLAYLTPVVVSHGTAILGEAHEIANVDDVTNLEVVRLRHELQVRWSFPPNCEKAIALYRNDQFPDGPLDHAATSKIWTKAEYMREGGCWAINPLLEQDYYIAVYAEIEQQGTVIRSSGYSSRIKVPIASYIEISYEIRRQRRGAFAKGRLSLRFNLKGNGTVPAMVLVAKQGAMPINKRDGEVILTLPERPTTETWDQPFKALEFTNTYGRLYLADDRLYDTVGGHVRLNHPRAEKAKLF